MYFPYLRGKQYELLALRELVPVLNGNKVIPIIEPVKNNMAPLKTALDVMAKHNITVQLVVNPEVGDFKNNSTELVSFVNELLKNGYDNIIPSFIVTSDREFEKVRSIIETNSYNVTGFSFIHLNKVNDLDTLNNFCKDNHCLFHVVQIAHLYATRRKLGKNVCMLNDYFNRQINNRDYLKIPFEVFSSDYLYYTDEGCIAFSDYQTIGTEYFESGGAAFAIAIHLTYKEDDTDDIQIAHFVSDNNTGRENPGGKFFEALEKLIEFVDAKGIKSIAVDKFREYYNSQSYPGLGVVKKLSIMHHIQLVQGLI